MALQIQLQQILNQSVEKAATYAYATALLNQAEEVNRDGQWKEILEQDFMDYGLSTFYIKSLIYKQVNEEKLKNIGILGGLNIYQNPLASGEDIEIILTYNIKIPFLPAWIPPITGINHTRKRMWVGREYNSIERDPIVYVTKNGTVYHTDLRCSYLKLSITEINYSDLHETRNKWGAKYYPCENCWINNKADKVFITMEGRRYHRKLSCKNLTRNIHSVPLSKVKNLKSCSRCSNNSFIE
ncbi:MAG: hypothetical protein ACLRZ7_08630 [Lachnospiraceae bacterium]